jgi:hypothetical protein
MGYQPTFIFQFVQLFVAVQQTGIPVIFRPIHNQFDFLSLYEYQFPIPHIETPLFLPARMVVQP